VESTLFVRDQCSWILWTILAHEFTSPRTCVIYRYKHVCIPSLIFKMDLTSIIYLLPTIYIPMNQQDMLYPRTLHELARYALPTNINPHDLKGHNHRFSRIFHSLQCIINVFLIIRQNARVIRQAKREI
jgi:hypothetical protein